MKQAILDFPQQFKKGLKAAQEVEVEKEVSSVVICGMGGSALPANLLLTTYPELKTPIYISRNYDLPRTDPDTLVICISYSGNTEETISSYNKARNKNLEPLAITTDGTLKQLAERSDLPVAVIPENSPAGRASSSIQPRQAVGYQYSALLKILSNCGVISDPESELLQAADNLKPEQLEDQGQQLADQLANKLPIIYASDSFKALARIWKIKFNENAKSLAFWNYFPELNHNEMTGFEQAAKQLDPEQLQILMLNHQENPKTLKRMELTKELLQERGISVNEIKIEGSSVLEKTFNSLLLSDWTTLHLAQRYGIDPEPVPIIEDFKDQL